ncbi:MAG: hypothetical protein PHQ81_03985 [Methanofollis sp.]|nr:hypothetical protein [Methanofollis sp.]
MVSWRNDRREEYFCVVARSFSHRVLESEGICLDLDDCMAWVEEIREEAVQK